MLCLLIDVSRLKVTTQMQGSFTMPRLIGQSTILKLPYAYHSPWEEVQSFIRSLFSIVFVIFSTICNALCMYPPFDYHVIISTDTIPSLCSIGYCEKEVIKDRMPIGHYGNGFKSGSMRLGKDVLVFTKPKNHNLLSVGFLSQTFQEALEVETIVIPIISFSDTDCILPLIYYGIVRLSSHPRFVHRTWGNSSLCNFA